jgi:hypothetical protein
MSEAKMTRAHYRFLADVLAEARPVGDTSGDAREAYWEWLVRYMGERLRETNPAFDFDRFVTAAKKGDA